MKTITINYEANTIEISSAFAKLAREYKSDAYSKLKEARDEFPTFTVSVIKPTSKKNSSAIKGLTYDTMKRYIVAHDDEEKSIMKTFISLSKKSEDNNYQIATYGEIKKWFKATFPNFEGVRFDTYKTMLAVNEAAKKAKEAASTIKLAKAS